MQIPKAIELLRMDIDDPGSVAIEDLDEAESLGIEALKRTIKARKYGSPIFIALLPGETEE